MKKISGIALALLLAMNASAALTVKQASGWLESAWMEFSGLSSSYKHYNAYVSADNGSSWTALDGALVREYQKNDETYGRVDALGLSAGSNYKLKVVPVNTSDVEVTADQVVSSALEVKAHDRAGFAHFNRSNQSEGIGAYNDNGTLKSGARVLYVTAANAKTVSLNMHVDRVTDEVERTGLQSIIQAYEKGNEVRPLAIRIIGCIKAADMDAFGSSAEGLQVKGKNDYYGGKFMNLTIEGVGDDASIHGFGILARNTSGLEFRNFAVLNCLDDCLSLDTKNSHIWIHNIDFFYGKTGGDADQAKGDGSLDVKSGTKNCTFSYNHFWDSGKCSLGGMSGESTDLYNTYHHNWFDHSDSRHPRIRTMSMHIYNNYYDGNAKYGVGMTSGGSAFVENNYFRHCKYPMLTSKQGSDISGGGTGTFSGEPGGVIKAYGNYIVDAQRYITYQQANAGSNDPQPTRTGGGFDYSGSSIYNVALTNVFTDLNNITIVQTEAPASGKVTGKNSLNLTAAGDASFTMPGGIVWSWHNSSAGATMAKQYGNYVQPNGGNRVITIPSEEGDVITIKLVSAVSDFTITGVEEAISSLGTSNTLHATGVVTITFGSNAAKIQAIKYSPAGAPAGLPVDGNDWDAYEVANRADQVPSSVTCLLGGTSYNNFDQSYLSRYTPDDAVDVPGIVTGVYGAGRCQHGDFQWVFDNTTEDTNYDVIPGLKSAITSYSNTALQGIIGNADLQAGGDDNPGTDPVNPNPGDDPTPSNGNYELHFTGNQASNSFYTVSGNFSNSKGTATYNGVTYTIALKMESSTSVTFTTTEQLDFVFVMNPNGNMKIDGTAENADANGIILKTLAAGSHELTKKDSHSLFYINVVGGSTPGTDPVDPTPGDDPTPGTESCALLSYMVVDGTDAVTAVSSFSEAFALTNATVAGQATSDALSYYAEITQTAASNAWGQTKITSTSCSNIWLEAKDGNANKVIYKAYADYIQPNGSGACLFVSDLAAGDTVKVTLKEALAGVTVEGATESLVSMVVGENDFIMAAGQTTFKMYSKTGSTTTKWKLQTVAIGKYNGENPGTDPVDPNPGTDPTPSNGNVIVDFANNIGTFTAAGTCEITTAASKYDANTKTPAKAMKFANSFNSKDSDGNPTFAVNYVAVTPAEGGFLAGDTIRIAHYYNNSAEKVTAIAIYDELSETADQVLKTASSINGRTAAGKPELEEFILTAPLPVLYLARDGGTTTFVMDFIVTRPENAGPATSVEDIESSSSVSKILRNGQILILRGEEVYTISGVRIQ
ncbi:MAG: hypothetical protein MJZ89_06205 [Paludibacteraceae bacterium]|nr:hypothetical protein [Paludibacteraceae bacterium]